MAAVLWIWPSCWGRKARALPPPLYNRPFGDFRGMDGSCMIRCGAHLLAGENYFWFGLERWEGSSVAYGLL